MTEQTNSDGTDEAGAEPSMVELYIDTDVCVGMGMCEVVEPTVFEINDDAISEVVGSAIFPADRAKKVMFECPSGAIKAKS